MDHILSSNKWCRHYAGMHNTDTCRAGVRYADVRGANRNHPCFKDRCEGTACASQSFRTDEEAWQAIEDSRSVLAEFVTKLATNVCPTCDQTVERQRQVGPCVYADPCGHRLYQGRVSQKEIS